MRAAAARYAGRHSDDQARVHSFGRGTLPRQKNTKMSDTNGIKSGNAYYELSLRDGKLEAGLKKWKSKMAAYGAAFRSIGAKAFAFGAALRAPLALAESLFASMGSEMSRMAAKTGVSVEALSQLRYAAKQSGLEFEDLGMSFRKLQNKLGQAEQGNSEAIRSFAKLGLSVAQLRSMAPDQQFEAIASRISTIVDPAQRAAIAIEIFGKNGTALLPLLDQGASGIERLRKQADALGLTMKGADAQAALKLQQGLSTLWDTVKMGAFNVGAALAPALQDLASKAAAVFATLGKWVSQHRELIVLVAKVAAGTIAAGVAIYALGGVFSAASVAIGGLATAVKLAGAAFGLLLSPLGLIASAIGGAIGYALYAGGAFSEMAQTFSVAWEGIKNALSSGDLGLAGRIAVNGLKIAFLQGLDALSNVVGGGVGDLIRTIGGQLASGDLAGAWDTIVSALGAAWSQFSAFVKATWAGVVANVQKGMAFIVHAFEKAMIDAAALKAAVVGETEDHSAVVYGGAYSRLKPGEKSLVGPVARDYAREQADKKYLEALKSADAGANAKADEAFKIRDTEVKPFEFHVKAGASAFKDALRDAEADQAKAVKAAAAGAAAAAPGANPLAPVNEGRDSLASAAGRTAGTFSARGAIGLGSGSNLERIAGQQLASLRRIEKNQAAANWNGAQNGAGLVMPV
jgi:hypothetical protein